MSGSDVKESICVRSFWGTVIHENSTLIGKGIFVLYEALAVIPNTNFITIAYILTFATRSDRQRM